MHRSYRLVVEVEDLQQMFLHFLTVSSPEEILNAGSCSLKIDHINTVEVAKAVSIAYPNTLERLKQTVQTPTET